MIVKIITPFYDMRSSAMKFKSRPGLVIAGYGVLDNDYIVLPISTISDKRRRNQDYDIKINPIDYPDCNLNKISYIRTHKQVTINRKEIGGVICDFKNLYEDKYLEIISKLEQFDKEKVEYAL
ncbi:type II toxin-antitoxin system PemK/MazF family toxin [Thomasclavelia cocleata]|uniref:type II toxin-antitoxin system PemK/MazF family toxin n=1 Tax=Thomasclavelia cocleata TaxID=69824 RepID=UPI00243185D5|nr:type II toxin-antitoxin system PemK/MazF family toxin [Thomasclavelia cocleata]